jgi:hypothetical protein
MAKPRSKAKKAKVARVMHEFGAGMLHSGSKAGPKVTGRKQAIAIAISESGQDMPMKRKRGIVMGR